MPQGQPEGRRNKGQTPQAVVALAGRVIRDIGDALIVLAQSPRTRDHPLIDLVGPLREAARRNFLFVIREQEIPVAVIVLHRRSEPAEAEPSGGSGATPTLTSLSNWEAGSHLAVLELFSVRDDHDEALREKAVALLADFTSKTQTGN